MWTTTTTNLTLLTYLLTYLFTYIRTYLLIYLHTYLHTYLLTYLLTYVLTYLFTYLLTPWCRVLLEKLTGSQLVKKFPAIYGTRRFITALTSVRHVAKKCDSSVLNGMKFQKDFRVREYHGEHAMSIALHTSLTCTPHMHTSQPTTINHYMQALFKTKNLQVTAICISTKLLGIQLLTIMCNNLYFQGQYTEDDVLTAGLCPSKHSEKLLSNHSNKSRTETDGVHTHRQRHKGL